MLRDTVRRAFTATGKTTEEADEFYKLCEQSYAEDDVTGPLLNLTYHVAESKIRIESLERMFEQLKESIDNKAVLSDDDKAELSEEMFNTIEPMLRELIKEEVTTGDTADSIDAKIAVSIGKIIDTAVGHFQMKIFTAHIPKEIKRERDDGAHSHDGACAQAKRQCTCTAVPASPASPPYSPQTSPPGCGGTFV